MSSFSNDDWKLVQDIFTKASEMVAIDREAFIKGQLAGRTDLVDEVNSLLEALEGADEFLEKPVAEKWIEPGLTGIPEFRSGDRIGGFEMIKKLGAGSFGTVYLARQLSLDRILAVKITPDLGEEARTMAPLEHDYIVRVFSSETVPVNRRNFRFLCMQYISGATLQEWLDEVREKKLSRPGGKPLIDFLEPRRFHAASSSLLSERDAISKLDFVEIVLWLGIRMCEALEFAHQKGVLHLDVKPGNILLNHYGRPLLTDFNISSSQAALFPDRQMFGGTWNYMSPEHKGAFEAHQKGQAAPALDVRTDLFSLGEVLRAVLTAGGLDASSPQSTTELELQTLLDHATAADPKDRPASAGGLRGQLVSCLKRYRLLKNFPALGPLLDLCAEHPFLSLVLAALLPEFVASLVNIAYNSLRIVSTLSESQQQLFGKLIVLYNPVIYVIGTLIGLRLLIPIYRFHKQRRAAYAPTPEMASYRASLRQHVLDIPVKSGILISAGWMMSAAFFPTALHLLSPEGLAPRLVEHFLISFTLSWLIALPLSFLFTQTICLRLLYPELLTGSPSPQETAREELKKVPTRLHLAQRFVGIIPLLGAALVIVTTPYSVSSSALVNFQFLVGLLLGTAGLGFVASFAGAHESSQSLFTLRGVEPTKNPPAPLAKVAPGL